MLGRLIYQLKCGDDLEGLRFAHVAHFPFKISDLFTSTGGAQCRVGVCSCGDSFPRARNAGNRKSCLRFPKQKDYLTHSPFLYLQSRFSISSIPALGRFPVLQPTSNRQVPSFHSSAGGYFSTGGDCPTGERFKVAPCQGHVREKYRERGADPLPAPALRPR